MSWHSFGRRLLGALRLNGDTYRELASSPDALPQAVAVILLGSLASAVVYLVNGASPGLSVDIDWGRYPVSRESNAVAALAGAVLDAGWGLFVWAGQAAIIWWIWNRLSSRPKRWSAIAAPLGFANVPVILFALLEIVPVIGGILGAVGLFWVLIASIIAIRASLAIGWGRAVGLMVISVLLLLPFSIALSRLT